MNMIKKNESTWPIAPNNFSLGLLKIKKNTITNQTKGSVYKKTLDD